MYWVIVFNKFLLKIFVIFSGIKSIIYLFTASHIHFILIQNVLMINSVPTIYLISCLTSTLHISLQYVLKYHSSRYIFYLAKSTEFTNYL